LEHPVLRHRLPKKRRAARTPLTAPARHQARSPSALKPSALKPSALNPSPLPGAAGPRARLSGASLFATGPCVAGLCALERMRPRTAARAELGSRRALRPVLRGGLHARDADLCALERCDHGLLHDGGGAWLSPRPPASPPGGLRARNGARLSPRTPGAPRTPWTPS